MAWPRADVGKAQALQNFTHITFVIFHAKALLDDALQIDPPPAHNAINLPIRSCLNKLRQIRFLLVLLYRSQLCNNFQGPFR